MTDQTATAARGSLHCPDHDVALIPHEAPMRSADRSLMCPAEPDGMMSTNNRRCVRCGARNASWMSGLCDTHVRDYYRSLDEQKREI